MRYMRATDPAYIVLCIRAELAQRGMYHKDLAAHLGITVKHLSQMMNGRNRMSMPILFGCLDYLDMALLLVPDSKEALDQNRTKP